MKKIIFRIIMVVLALGLVFSGIIVYSEKVHILAFVENIKKALGEQNGTRAAYTVTNTTKVDVTYLEANGVIEHEHTFKTMYDENKHWSECTVCSERKDELVHSYNTTWATGSESCSQNNYYTNTCSCGYSYIGHKPCVWDGKNYGRASYRHLKKCIVCNTFCYYGYYYNNKFYNDPAMAQCTNKNGVLINCNTGGTCAICSRAWNKGEHSFNTYSNTGVLECEICGNQYGTYVVEVTQISDSPAEYKMVTEYNLVNATYNSIQTNIDFTDVMESVQRKIIDKISDTQFKVETITKFKDTYKVGFEFYYNTYITINGKKIAIKDGPNGFVYPDTEKPKISSITMSNVGEELTEWSRTKPILISGTENYCDTVNVTILDDNGNTVFEGSGNVSSNNFSISCIPEVEADTNGRTFIAILKDACNNEVTKEFKIAKVDAIPPVAISSDDITGQWAKSRKFTFRAADGGSGEVQIAFNDIEDLALANFDGNEYIREYEFYGDVYSPKQLSVLYRDKLGNTSIQMITIDNLDNTAPTITKASIHNNVVTIEAHDRHETLGEGSGIAKYRYITSDERIISPNVSIGIESTSNKFIVDDVYKVKYIYIIAEDIVGNVSEVYELKVPELVLTSSVDLSLADGKGGVILDWSTYDVTDKYFVVYRKYGDSANWETIVSLDEKFTGNTYTDILGNDKAKPDVPNVTTITGDAQNNNIKIEATSNDNGTKYTYYIESYDCAGSLITISN